MMTNVDIAIIGAGLGGIALATQLKNKDVLLLEKSRGIGGRVATRRFAEGVLNHGVEEFHVQHGLLKILVALGIKQNLLNLEIDLCTPKKGFNEWIKLIAKDLTIQKECRIERFEYKSGTYQLYDNNNQVVLNCKKLVLAMPATQTYELLKASGIECDILLDVIYDSQIQFFVKLRDDIKLTLTQDSFYGVKKINDVYWFTVKAQFISQYLELDKEQLTALFKSKLEINDQDMIESHAHKWRYSQAMRTIAPLHQLAYADRGLYMLGDYFYGDSLNALMRSVVDIYEELTLEPWISSL